jgi:endonuclease/exonuclease/phosphatase family metal-dependent hydrolase
MKKTTIILGVFAALCLYCAKENPVKTAGPSPFVSASGKDTALSFLTFNMAIGMEVEKILLKDLKDSVTVLQEGKNLYTQYKESVSPQRVQAVADSIALLSPDVIALQEVLFLKNNYAADSMDFAADFLKELNLKSNTPYVILKQVLNPIHLLLAVKNDTLNDSLDLFFQEGNALLYKNNLTLLQSDTIVFFAGLINLPYLKTTLDIRRGAQYARLSTPGQAMISVFNTHLEVLSFINQTQASELLTFVKEKTDTGSATVLLGDYNNAPGTSVVTNIISNRFADTYAEIKTDSACTCCYDITDIQTQLSRRIDYVFAKNIVRVQEVVIPLTGYFSYNGLYYRFSDHTGVMATLVFH